MEQLNNYLQLLENGAYAAMAAAVLGVVNLIILVIVLAQPGKRS